MIISPLQVWLLHVVDRVVEVEAVYVQCGPNFGLIHLTIHSQNANSTSSTRRGTPLAGPRFRLGVLFFLNH